MKKLSLLPLLTVVPGHRVDERELGLLVLQHVNLVEVLLEGLDVPEVQLPKQAFSLCGEHWP